MKVEPEPSHLGDGATGFGLIEIVISMFLLGLLAIAFLPLLVTSMKTTVVNSSVATASQLVNQQMDQARAAGSTCALITAFGGMVLSAGPPDARGMTYQPARAVGPCPTSYPGTVKVTVTVSVLGATFAPVTATTLVFLKAP